MSARSDASSSTVRDVVDQDVITEWLDAAAVHWLPRASADRPGRRPDPDAAALSGVIPSWRGRLAAVLADPAVPVRWAPGEQPPAVQLVDAWVAAFAASLGAALAVPADPDIQDAQPILLASALAGAGAMVAGSGLDGPDLGTEIALAGAAGEAAVDVGSDGGSLAAVARAAADAVAVRTVHEHGPGAQIGALVRLLADVIAPVVGPDENLVRYDLWFRLGGGPELPDRLRRALTEGTRPGTVLEIDLDPVGAGTWQVHLLVRQAGPVIEALWALGRPSRLSIEVH